MITAPLVDEFVKEQRKAEREALKLATIEAAESTLENPDVRQAFMAILKAAGALSQAERFRDARTLLLTTLEMTLRLHFQIVNGRADPGDIGASGWLKRLRSLGAVSHKTYCAAIEVVRRPPPYDGQYVADLWPIVKRFTLVTFSTPEQAEKIRLPA